MTMAVGFTCKDGLVIASDRQFTGETYTYQGCKLSELRWANGIAMWGYAGFPETARRFRDELGKRFDQNTRRERQNLQACVKLIAFAVSATAQEKLVHTGPFGAPVMVADEGGNFSAAIVVLKAKDVTFVIPDITSAAWRAWNIPEFRKSGKYPVRLYYWFRTTKLCEAQGHTAAQCSELGFLAQTMIVNSRNHTVHYLWSVLIDRDGVSDITTIHRENRDAAGWVVIDRITKIVQNESQRR